MAQSAVESGGGSESCVATSCWACTSSVACAEDSNIWIFSVAFVIIAPLIACLVSIMQAFMRNVDGSPNMIMGFIPSCVTLVLAVWGVLLWANMTGECHHFYETTYPNLLLLFKISVIFGVPGASPMATKQKRCVIASAR